MHYGNAFSYLQNAVDDKVFGNLVKVRELNQYE